MRATSAALEAGYRHLDTATVYGNEGEVGRALAESGVPRDDVFLTTKCPPDRAGRELDTLRESLELLQTDHVDLWLIHWPGDGSANVDMWRAFVEARESGLAREIGVSNFDAALIDEVTDAAGVRARGQPDRVEPAAVRRRRGRRAPGARHRAGGLQRAAGWHPRPSRHRGRSRSGSGGPRRR